MCTWEDANKWEREWWGSCVNTLAEELKQLVYARKMGLPLIAGYRIPLYGKSVLDIGGGPCSLLLKSLDCDRPAVVDPCAYPDWVAERYSEAGIRWRMQRAEDLVVSDAEPEYDEVWIYNVLQHTDDPALIAEHARSLGKVVRVFEWIDTCVNEGHPHTLNETQLNKWFNGQGKTEQLNESGCIGRCWYGVFWSKK